MKLAEALLLRADLQKKLASLRVEFGYSGNELENRNQREYNLTRGSGRTWDPGSGQGVENILGGPDAEGGITPFANLPITTDNKPLTLH